LQVLKSRGSIPSCAAQNSTRGLVDRGSARWCLATIPLCLWDYEPRLKIGDRLIMAAFGGGFTWAGAYLTWAYEGAAGQ